MVTEQVEVPVQAPDQPVKVEPRAGEAERVTSVPCAKEAEQVVPQEMPRGEDVTVPEPVPPFWSERVKRFWEKLAVTLWLAVMERVQVEVPVQAPDQPVKV